MPPRARNPASATGHNPGWHAPERALRVPAEPPARPAIASLGLGARRRRNEQAQLPEGLLDLGDLRPVRREVTVAQGCLGQLEVLVGIGDQGRHVTGRRAARRGLASQSGPG